ncbi:MAG: hypothetical protein ACKO6K_00760, partial [Chitinophagaceae bacterium]
RRHKLTLTNLLQSVKGVSFVRLPDPEGDSATFLNLLLPDQESAQRCVQQLQQAGLGGFNYWFTNMYHFINQWDHLKELRVASALPINILGAPQSYATLQLPKSQHTIGRLISFGIRCTWKDEEVVQLGKQIASCILKALQPAHV